MRKDQKKQIDDFIEVVLEVHQEINKAMTNENYSNITYFLKLCQDGAFSLIDFVENIEGEGLTAISLLDNYCDLVYQIYNNFDSGIYIFDVYLQLQELFSTIIESIKTEIKVKKEIVYLPYKASMWDSLESQWRKSEADPDCDVYVIPIPYFDRKSNGEVNEVYYEANQMPSYVTITKYEEYDFANRQPDEIYIHNPYDDSNFVTSVHPYFYSKNLKQFTEKLIYIPYFVLDEIEIENKEMLESIKDFVLLPGVINSDVIIVQSENMKQCYVQCLVDYAGKNTRPIWENKILGIGSPKFDKVKNTKREDIDIPEEWEKVLLKPDGTFKKVILYNTSIGALLSNNEKMLVKIQNTLKTFKEYVDDVVLIWRPHPLLKSTIISMRPSLWTEYEKIVNEFRSENWGIYDDTSDLNRAIAISDGYYGDPSSLVQLYAEVQKPILIQDVEISE